MGGASKVINLTSLTVTVHSTEFGRLVIPANGEVRGVFSDSHLKALRTFPSIRVVYVRKSRRKGDR